MSKKREKEGEIEAKKRNTNENKSSEKSYKNGKKQQQEINHFILVINFVILFSDRFVLVWFFFLLFWFGFCSFIPLRWVGKCTIITDTLVTVLTRFLN